MSAFAENPFFFIVDNNPSFLSGNVLKDSRKIVELTDVACSTRRSSLSSLSASRDSAVPAFLTKNHLKNEWDKIRNDMHDQSGRCKSRRDDYNMSNKNGFPGMYYSRECRKNSTNPQSPWTMNSRASPTIHQNYPRRKSVSKKTNHSTMGHPERDAWSRYWTDSTPSNYGKTHGKANVDGYTLLRNQYDPVRGRQGFESHRPAYQHGIQRGYPAGRSSKASTNANMSDGSRRGDSYMPRDRRTRWESMKSPMYDANLYMTPQQRRQSNFVYENLDDYSSEISDDSKRDRTHGSRIRSRTYSPPVDRAKYQLLRNHYNEDDDDEYFSMSTDNFNVDDHARRNTKDIDGTMGRDALITSQLAGHPGISETSSINLMLDISRSSTLIGEKACYESRDRVNRDNAWIFNANNRERYKKRNAVYNDNHCSLNCCENSQPRVLQGKNDALSSRSKHGYHTFSKKNLTDTLPRGSSYSVFPNKNSNENAFSTMKTVCAETNTDPLDFQKESFADARVIFTAEVSQVAIHKSESCNIVEEKGELLKKPSSTKVSEVNECSKIADDTSATETNKKLKTAVGLIGSTTAYLKRKFASSNEKNSDELMTSCHHSVKDDVKRRRAETASKLPVRIGARNKSRNPMPNSPSFESHASKGGSTGDRAASPDPEDRRARTKPRGRATSPYSRELSKSRQLRAGSNDQSPYTKMESNELQLHPAIGSNPQESVAFSRRPIKSAKDSKSPVKNQQRRPLAVDTKGKRDSKYINLIRKPKQK